MQDLAKFRLRKAGLLPGPNRVCGICLRRIRARVSRISMAEQGWPSAWRSTAKCIHFGAGRCSWYPQNNATATTLASDKYFTNIILERAGIGTLGGDYFFLHERFARPAPRGHEIEDALKYFKKLGATAFAKPLPDRAAISHKPCTTKLRSSYILSVSRCYDSDPDAAAGFRRRIPRLPVGRRCTVCGAQISACCAGRRRAFDP